MAGITLTANSVVRRGGGSVQSQESLTQSTATAIQSLSVTTDVSVLGMGTATGFARNRYLLPTTSAVEGQEKVVVATGTGEAYLDLAGGTATGGYVFSTADSWITARLINGDWRPIGTGATLATATNS